MNVEDHSAHHTCRLLSTSNPRIGNKPMGNTTSVILFECKVKDFFLLRLIACLLQKPQPCYVQKALGCLRKVLLCGPSQLQPSGKLRSGNTSFECVPRACIHRSVRSNCLSFWDRTACMTLHHSCLWKHEQSPSVSQPEIHARKRHHIQKAYLSFIRCRRDAWHVAGKYSPRPKELTS